MKQLDTKGNLAVARGVFQAGLAAAKRVVQAAIEDRAFPGAAYGLLVGQQSWVESLGRQTYDPDSQAILPQTRYDLASLTKVLSTTAMAMLLWQTGKLDLDTRLGDLLPGFIVGQPDARTRMSVTLRMLLGHTSGLPAHRPYFLRCNSPAELYRAVLHTPLEATPGATVQYSDPGFILLSKALEVLANEPLTSFCRNRVFLPLGMESTRFCPGPGERSSIPPTEIDKSFRHSIVQGVVHDENCYALQGVAGHAGLFGTAADVLRFAAAMLGHAPQTTEAALFTQATIETFTRRAGSPERTTRALGWDTPSATSSSCGATFSPVSFGHLGFTGTSLWIDPTRQLAAVLLTNRTFPTRENKKIQVVRPLFHDALLQHVKTHTIVTDIAD